MSISEIFGAIARLFSWMVNYPIQWDLVFIVVGIFTALGIVLAIHETWTQR